MPRMNVGQEDGFVRTARVPYKVLYALLFTLVIVIIALLLPSNFKSSHPAFGQTKDVFLIKEDYAVYTYNSTYPLTAPQCKYDSALSIIVLICCKLIFHALSFPLYFVKKCVEYLFKIFSVFVVNIHTYKHT